MGHIYGGNHPAEVANLRARAGLTSRMLRGDAEVDGLLDIPGVSVYGETDDLTIKDPTAIFNVEGMTGFPTSLGPVRVREL